MRPRIDDPADIALFLDLDGTVIDIAGSPDGVFTPPELIATLNRLQQSLDGAVAILSGRTIADIDRMLAPLVMAAAGVHGGEMRSEPGSSIEMANGPVPAPLVEAIERLARSVSGVVVEHKHTAISLHYRAVPAKQSMLEAEMRKLMASHPSQLTLSHGRKVLELTPQSTSKGVALGRFMGRDRFRGRRPIMIGDDTQDEAAIEAASRLGGVGLKVEGEHFSRDAADFPDPEHVRRWLRDLADRIEP